jgi:transcription-repair coupling factor (superfamily II helicase)
LRNLQVEMIDRFGLLPPQVYNLFEVSRLRLKAQRLGIRAIEAGPSGGSIDFKQSTLVNPLTLVRLVQSDPHSYKLAGATRLRFEQDLPDIEERQRFLEQLLDTFTGEATETSANA